MFGLEHFSFNQAPGQVMPSKFISSIHAWTYRNCHDYALYIIVGSFLELISQSNAIHLRKSVPVYVPEIFATPCFFARFTHFQSSLTFFSVTLLLVSHESRRLFNVWVGVFAPPLPTPPQAV